MARTGYVYDERYLRHDPGSWHVERSDRLLVIHQRLVVSGLLPELICLKPTAAPLEWIEKLHDSEYITRFQRACEKGLPILDTGDCGICPESFGIARLAVGGVMAAGDAMMSGKVNNAFCAIRPPGHHAERSRAMGFCFFNNVALGARYLQEKYGLQRLAIVDWDVHHGNGTQHLFETDPTVLYISLHQDPGDLLPGHRQEDRNRQRAGIGNHLEPAVAAPQPRPGLSGGDNGLCPAGPGKFPAGLPDDFGRIRCPSERPAGPYGPDPGRLHGHGGFIGSLCQRLLRQPDHQRFGRRL